MRLGLRADWVVDGYISIHAPTRDAT